MRKFSFLLLLATVFLVLLAPQKAYASEESGDILVNPTSIAVFEPVPAYIVVHNLSNVCFVYDANLQPINGFIVSTGAPGHETPVGVYQIYQHVGTGYHLMVDGTYGRYSMRFKDGGYMFHSVCYAYAGAPEPIPEEVAALGTSVSRGCVRLSVEDAEWLYTATPNGCVVMVIND